jgi:hypothetical protein
MKLEKFRKGQMAIVMTLAIATLLGVMALCTDVGVMYYIHMQLQKGADAAALAGANYLSETLTGESIATTAGFTVAAACTGEPDDAQKAACTYAVNNNLAIDSSSMQMNEAAASATPNTPNIQVVAVKSGLPYMFGRVIGLSTYNVAAVATATQGATGATTGLFPIGMQCTPTCDLANLTPGSPVAFGVKFTTAVPDAAGNWQWLASGSGASSLGAAVTGGMPGVFSIGSTVGTKPGNDGNAGPVKSAFSSRMSSCPALSPDPCSGGNPSNIPSNDPCMVTVPAVNFQGANGSTSMAIEGFAQVYLEPTSTSTNITACFVKELDPKAIASGGPALGSLGRPELVQ